MFIGFCNNFNDRKELRIGSYFNLFLLLTSFVGTFSLVSFCDLSNDNTFSSDTFFLFYVCFSIAKNPPDFRQSFTNIIVSLHFLVKDLPFQRIVASSKQHLSASPWLTLVYGLCMYSCRKSIWSLREMEALSFCEYELFLLQKAHCSF